MSPTAVSGRAAASGRAARLPTVLRRSEAVAALPWRRWAGCALMCAALYAVPAGATNALDRVDLLLTERGVSLDRSAAEAAAVEAALRTTDPAARVLPARHLELPAVTNVVTLREEWPEAVFYLKLRGLERVSDGPLSGTLSNGLAREDAAGLLMDLRGAGGDALDEVDRFAGALCVCTSRLYTVRGATGAVEETHFAIPPAAGAPPPPVVLLVNGETRGASELLAAVLQGRPGVLLLGEKTAGDGRVREDLALGTGWVVRVATRRAVPTDRPDYAGAGVAPDIQVSASERYTAPWLPKDSDLSGARLSDKARTGLALMRRVGDDPVLARATDILLGLRAVRERSAAAVTNAADGGRP